MDKKLKLNSLFSLITQMVVYLAPLIISPYISRIFNSTLIGEYSYSFSIVSYFTMLAGLGVANYGIRMISKDKFDKQKSSNVFWELMVIKLIAVFISIVAYLPIAFNYNAYKYYLLIMLINIVSVFFDITWFFQGLEEFKVVCIRSISIKLLSLVAIFIFVKTIDDIYIYTLIQSLSVLIPNILLLPMLIKKICTPNGLKITRHLKYIIEVFLPTIAVSIYTILDKTMIGFITGDNDQVGFYEQAYKIIAVGDGIVTAIVPVFASRISSPTLNEEERKDILKNVFRIVSFLGIPLSIGILFASTAFVPLYYGEGYNDSIIIMQTLSFLPLIIGYSTIVHQVYFLPNLFTRKSMIVTFITAIVSVIINIPFIFWLRAEGAAIATLLTQIISTLICIVLLNKYLDFGKIIKITFKYFLSGIIMGASMFLISYFLDSIILELIISSFVGIIVYLFMTILLKDKLVFQLLTRSKNEKNNKNIEN